MSDLFSDRIRARYAETRDPTAATKPVVYQTPGHPMPAEWDAHNALRFAYYANVFVYRCVQIRAQCLYRVPFRVGADPSKPADYDVNHPLARLLGPPPGGPNQATSARRLLAWSLAQRIVTGRFAWELELGGNDVPIALWPLPSPYLKPIPTESGSNYFKGFTFGRSGEERRLAPEQVFYDWRPKADDWRQPESVLQAARLDVSVAVMQDRYDFAFLRNDARPATAVIHEGFATDAEDVAFQRQWDGRFRGPENAGKTLFVEAERDGSGSVEGAIAVKQLGLTQRDAEFIRRHAQKLQAICVALGTPLSKLGDASGRTFSNASEENRNWWEDTVLPDLDDLADAINIKLAPSFGDSVGWFDLNGVPALRPKRVSTDVGVPALLTSKVMWINEGRAELGLGAVTDGDRFLTDDEILLFKGGGGTPAERVASVTESRGDESPAVTAVAPIAAVAAGPVPVDVAAKELSRARSIITTEVNVGTLERVWERAFKRLFARQSKATLDRLTGKRGRQASRETRIPPDAIFDPEFWENATEEEAAALYEQVVAAGGARVAAQFGLAFDIDAPYVADFISARANQLAGQVTDTTYRQITDALVDGAAEGESIPDLARRITEVFEDASAIRATTIARTEVISAYNASAVTVASQLPPDVVGGQEWIATHDGRTRPAHSDADGQVVPIGAPFVVGGQLMAYPGDPNGGASQTVNCRCAVGLLTPEEMAERCRRIEVRAAKTLLATVREGARRFDPAAFRRVLEAVA